MRRARERDSSGLLDVAIQTASAAAGDDRPHRWSVGPPRGDRCAVRCLGHNLGTSRRTHSARGHLGVLAQCLAARQRLPAIADPHRPAGNPEQNKLTTAIPRPTFVTTAPGSRYFLTREDGYPHAWRTARSLSPSAVNPPPPTP